MGIESFFEVASVGVVVALSWWETRRVEERARPPEPVPARARERVVGRRCPYCHLAFAEDHEQVARVRCSACRARHHAVCWTEHGACSVYGCGARAPQPEQEPEEVASTDDPSATAADPSRAAALPTGSALTEGTSRG